MMNSIISNLKWSKRKGSLMLFLLLLCFCFQTKAQIPNVTSGYIGNTFNGGNNKWVQNHAYELDVASDGTMITASDWDEAGRCVGVFKDGEPVAYLKQFNGAGGHDCWGWGTSTKATAVDNNYLYLNDCNGFTQRYNRANNYSYVDAVNTGLAEGMTCSGSYVYMITPDGLVQKRVSSKLNLVALSFTVTGGYDLAVDNAGNIWVLTTNKEVLKFNSAGVNTGIKITAQRSGWKPSAVNYDAYNDLLLVPDNGPRRQVIKFNTSGIQVGTFGDLGGISAGAKGVVGDLRFWNILGCGTDASGNIYTALDENCVSLRKFNQAGVKQWEVLGTMFTDITSIDPASDGNDIYSINEHMKFNYATQQWSLYSMTVDRINNTADPRNIVSGTSITTSIIRRVNGNKLMFQTGMYAGGWDVYRFDGEIAIHTQGIWDIGWTSLPDKNGNIWYESGGRIKKITLTGFSGANPVFGPAIDMTTSLPDPMNKIERLEYDADKDVMYIAGWTNSAPNKANNWGLIGSTIACYPNWSTGNRTFSNTVLLTKDVEGFYPKAMSVADGYIFVGGSRDKGKLYVYNSSNLSSVGYIASPTSMGDLGWLDIPHAVQAFKKSNGQYVILVEDNYKGKNILYQWCPSGNCELTVPLKLVSFKVNMINGKPKLQWQTENEVNVSHFEIERSSDGTNFTKIKVLNSSGKGVYNTVDDSPLIGNNYYRLKMVDKDGSFEISNNQVVNVSLDYVSEFSVYPNPNNGNFTISPLQTNKQSRVTIFDQQGRKITEKYIQGPTVFKVGDMANGIYLIQVNSGGVVEYKKIVKE